MQHGTVVPIRRSSEGAHVVEQRPSYVVKVVVCRGFDSRPGSVPHF